MNKYNEAMKLLDKRFGNGKDNGVSLATIGHDPNVDGKPRPAVRNVDGYYEDGAFYVVTYTKSNKMDQIEANPAVAVAIHFEWFFASGIGENLGWVRDGKNAEMMKKVRAAFAQWYGNGHVNEEDPNTCLLCVRLTEGSILDEENANGEVRYHIDFVNKTAQ
ncbi:pyridoxamine 5'-phosphate oxidase family protein [Gorillibacterium timonense]|uniref:pyridoxamine 5'-phosphate oxidase family protein n=1 Tax=Gorillibacterium timonense TaxID=1689269 RepID=UPI00071C201B|nr:pyridoxamine 5'-phosphate oxidase family protein [Gorillibacterium timonense]